MKHIYIILFLIFLITDNVYGQSRFFILTDGWQTFNIQEYEHSYLSIGMGFSGLPDNNKFIQFYEIDKQGNFIDSRVYQMDSTRVTEIRNQQSLNRYEEELILGVTIRNQDNLLKAKRLKFNNDLTVVTDSSWQYISPEGDESIMFITHRVQANTIIHGLNYYTGSVVKSTLLSTDTLGNMIWETNFGCGAYCWMIPRHIHPTHDGGYIMTHTEERNSNNGPGIDDHDVVNIIKTDSLGTEQWRIHPGGEGNPYTSEHILLQPTDDGNYLCVWADNKIKTSNAGHYNFNPDATVWFAKIAPDGSKIWEKTIQDQIDMWDVDAGGYTMRQMIRASDGNFVIAVNWGLIKVNQEGNIIWARHHNPLNIEPSYEQIIIYKMYGINETSDGGFILTGEFEAREGTDFPEFLQTGFLLKVDEYGCLEAGCQEDDPIVSVEVPVLSEHKLLIYPNPAKDYVIIEYATIEFSKELSIIITDLNGQIVYNKQLGYPHELVIITDRFPTGQYFCTLKDGNKIIRTERFILVH